jgi:hypothetical protein
VFRSKKHCSNIAETNAEIFYLFNVFRLDDSRISSKPAAEHLDHCDKIFALCFSHLPS